MFSSRAITWPLATLLPTAEPWDGNRLAPDAPWISDLVELIQMAAVIPEWQPLAQQLRAGPRAWPARTAAETETALTAMALSGGVQGRVHLDEEVHVAFGRRRAPRITAEQDDPPRAKTFHDRPRQRVDFVYLHACRSNHGRLTP